MPLDYRSSRAIDPAMPQGSYGSCRVLLRLLCDGLLMTLLVAAVLFGLLGLVFWLFGDRPGDLHFRIK